MFIWILIYNLAFGCLLLILRAVIMARKPSVYPIITENFSYRREPNTSWPPIIIHTRRYFNLSLNHLQKFVVSLFQLAVKDNLHFLEP